MNLLTIEMEGSSSQQSEISLGAQMQGGSAGPQLPRYGAVSNFHYGYVT
jgi:hypothetical protein